MTPIVSSDNNEATVLFPWGTITIRNNPPAEVLQGEFIRKAIEAGEIKTVHPRSHQPEPPQLDAGPGATVRSYRKLGDREPLMHGDSCRHKTRGGDWLQIAYVEEGIHASSRGDYEFRRPIDSPAQDTPQPSEKKPLIVEAGKRYVRDDRAITNPLVVNTHENYKEYPLYDPKYQFRYSLKGQSMDGWRHNSDLVSEYIEPEKEDEHADFPGEGYRLLKSGEKIPPDAEQLVGKSKWIPTKYAGCHVCTTTQRVKTEPSPGEGWRWLVPDVDTLGEKDEYRAYGGWAKCARQLSGAKVSHARTFRRNLTYEGLDALPDGYREAAKANWDRDYLAPSNVWNSKEATALFSSFAWINAPEWRSFWYKVARHYESDHELPPLPLYSIVNGKLTCPTDGTGTTRAQAISDNITRLKTELKQAKKLK